MPQSLEVSSVKSAERTVRILEELAGSPVRLTVSELQERMNYPRSSLHALIRTLRELKWVEADESGTRFGVGPHALLSGTAYLDRDPALPYAYEALEDLRDKTGYTTHYARRDDSHVLYLASRESRDASRVVPRVGRRLPAHVTALGQALLAQLTSAEVAEISPPPLARYTSNTIVQFPALFDALDSARSHGYAFERGQGTESIACVAATVDYRIPATDAISCSMPANVPQREVAHVAVAVVEATQRLAATLRLNGIR